MYAAVLRDPASVPQYESFADPVVDGDEVVLKVLAAGLHPLVRSVASGKHYSSKGHYPLIPGVDGVAALPDGRPAYFSFPRAPYGSFAELVATAPSRCLPLADNLAPELAAGMVNPGMSSVAALGLRGQLVAGESVLILGATGSAGQLSVQVARALGARRVVAAGRNVEALAGLAVDAILKIDAPDFAEQVTRELTANRVDVVLDYLWGPPAEAVLTVLASKAVGHASHRTRFVQVGEMAGRALSLPAAVLRSTAIELLGSGFGSVSMEQIMQCVTQVIAFAAQGVLRLDVLRVPLADVATTWAAVGETRRVVFVP